MNKNYDDIIDLPHHVSPKHPRMSISDRAAQFAPFAALVGYGDAVKEVARHTDIQTQISDDGVAELDMKLRLLSSRLKEHPSVCIAYFVHDEKKDGGKYVNKKGYVKKIDEFEKYLVLTDGTSIPFADIVGIDSNL